MIHYTKVWCSSLNSLQDKRQIHWTMKYRLAWPIFIFRSKVGSYCCINWKYDTHPTISLQDIRQNQWTVQYRSPWPTFILRSKVVSHWLIIKKFDVHPSNSRQHIRQNHWTVKYKSWWPSPRDTQLNVIRLTDVWPSISINCLHNKKVENPF